VSLYAADAVYVSGPGPVRHGIDDIKAHYQKQLAPGFSEFHIDVRTIVVDGPTVMVERVDRFALGGKTFEIPAVGVFEIDDAGRIKRFSDYFDLQSIRDQFAAAGFVAGQPQE